MHQSISPAILYLGTPVVLVSTVNENGSDNLAPMSSAFWLGWRCIIGISALSKTTENLLHTRQGVLCLPSADQVNAVDRLAKTTGSDPVPESKRQKGYHHVTDKFSISGFTRQDAHTVDASRVKECPVQMEVVVEAVHPLAEDDPAQKGRIMIIELRVQKVHIEESILVEDQPNRVDPDKWKPLIMSFQEFYTLGSKVHRSTLAEIPEQLYNTPDREKASPLSTLP